MSHEPKCAPAQKLAEQEAVLVRAGEVWHKVQLRKVREVIEQHVKQCERCSQGVRKSSSGS